MIAIIGFTGAASAQVAVDPTRPPEGLAINATDTDDAGGAGGVMLQTVMISPTQKAAIISGVMVKLGEKYGDAVLVKVSESEVVLKSGDAQQVLRLHPGVDKREIAPVAEKGAQRRGKARAGAAQPR
jgi:MSHA biogenesis protein MshK